MSQVSTDCASNLLNACMQLSAPAVAQRIIDGAACSHVALSCSRWFCSGFLGAVDRPVSACAVVSEMITYLSTHVDLRPLSGSRTCFTKDTVVSDTPLVQPVFCRMRLDLFRMQKGIDGCCFNVLEAGKWLRSALGICTAPGISGTRYMLVTCASWHY